MTDYELAQLRLRAFDMLDGWGRHNEKDVFVVHDLEKRKEIALDFVDWAKTPAEPSKEQAERIIAEAIDLKNRVA